MTFNKSLVFESNPDTRFCSKKRFIHHTDNPYFKKYYWKMRIALMLAWALNRLGGYSAKMLRAKWLNTRFLRKFIDFKTGKSLTGLHIRVDTYFERIACLK